MIDPKHIKPLAWTALLSGILCWLLSSIILVGLDVVAVISGFLVLKQVKDKNQNLRKFALIGMWLGAIKFVYIVLMIFWVFIAFMINPVAH